MRSQQQKNGDRMYKHTNKKELQKINNQSFLSLSKYKLLFIILEATTPVCIYYIYQLSLQLELKSLSIISKQGTHTLQSLNQKYQRRMLIRQDRIQINKLEISSEYYRISDPSNIISSVLFITPLSNKSISSILLSCHLPLLQSSKQQPSHKINNFPFSVISPQSLTHIMPTTSTTHPSLFCPLSNQQILIKYSSFLTDCNYLYIQMGKKIEGEKQSSRAPQKCAVCMEKNAFTSIDCVHRFCMQCITKWTNRNNSCPLCRAEISEIRYGKRIKKVTRKIKVRAASVVPREDPPIQITWKPVYLVGIPYMNYYYLMASFFHQA